MTIHFERLIGAAGDVKELEYVSALHQTDTTGVRTDGSLRDDDIRLFLLSRYGIDVTVEHVRETVLKGLGGGSGEDDCIDLMEMVAILMIPTLLKAAQVETSSVPLNPRLILPKSGLLEFVLGMILSDVTGSQAPKLLNTALMKQILKAYGEFELAEDENLLVEMIQAAKPSQSPFQDEDETLTVLDLHSFARALTHDVQFYNVKNEINAASNFDDVFHINDVRDGEYSMKGTESTDEETASQRRRSTISQQQQLMTMMQPVERRETASAIDFVAGTYRSKTLTVLLWASFILTYFAYDYNFAKEYTNKLDCEPYEYTYKDPWMHNRASIACGVATAFLQWIIIFIVTSVYGVAFVGFGSIGNSAYCTWFGRPLIGMTVVFGATFIPFWTQQYQQQQLSELSNKYLRLTSLALGAIVCFLHLIHAFTLLSPMKVFHWKRVYDASTVMGEVHIKQAAAHKLSGMVQNAFEILRMRDHDGVVDTNFGHGMFAFARHGKKYQEVGGYSWTWRQVFNGELVKKEGIWFSARFLASNIAQYIASIFVLLAGIGLTIEARRAYNTDSAKNEVIKALKHALNFDVQEPFVMSMMEGVSVSFVDYLTQQVPDIDCSKVASASLASLSTACQKVDGVVRCDQNSTINYVCSLMNLEPRIMADISAHASEFLAFLAASGYNVGEVRRFLKNEIERATDSVILTLYPAERFMVVLPLVAATLFAFTVSVYLATTYLPSVTSTTLQLRSGAIPTLHDKNFHKYRAAPDRVTIVTGSMFWGALFSSTIVGGIVGIIVFAFLWQVTVYFSQRFVALVAGLVSVIVLKQCMLRCCRCAMYRSFYRKRPASANVTSLALECANFALSVGFIFIRMITLLLTAAVFIGRIDTPFLAPGVGRIGSFEFDGYPYIYRQDILASEAHRHPYIETLGVMYLMKLRYGENFGKTAGSCWRLLFVYALMPWLHKYRVLARPDLRSSMVGSTMRSLRNMRSLRGLCSNSEDDDDSNVDDAENDAASYPTSKRASDTGDASRSALRQSSGMMDDEGMEVWQLRGQTSVPKYMETSWRKSISHIDHVVKVLQWKTGTEVVATNLQDDEKPRQAAVSDYPDDAGEDLYFARKDVDCDVKDFADFTPASVESVVAGLKELKKDMEELKTENENLRAKVHGAVSTTMRTRDKKPLRFQW